MKSLEDFVVDARVKQLRLQVKPEHLDRAARSSHEGLFHIPLLAVCILVVARRLKPHLRTSELASWTGATLGHHFYGAQAARRKLEWSIQHRRRCADALLFLENIQLARVEETPERHVVCTQAGLDFLAQRARKPDEIGTCFWQVGLAHFGSLIWPTPWDVEGLRG
jgi:hypothetical protein